MQDPPRPPLAVCHLWGLLQARLMCRPQVAGCWHDGLLIVVIQDNTARRILLLFPAFGSSWCPPDRSMPSQSLTKICYMIVSIISPLAICHTQCLRTNS